MTDQVDIIDAADETVSVRGTLIGGLFVPDHRLVDSNGDELTALAMDAQGYGGSVTFTPAAAAYTAGDILDVAKEMTGIGPTGGGHVMLTYAKLVTNTSALLSGEAGYWARLYSVTPPSAHADNAAWDLPSGDRASYLGKIYLPTATDEGSTLVCEVEDLRKQIVLTSSSLWVELQTVGGMTVVGTVPRVLTINAQRV